VRKLNSVIAYQHQTRQDRKIFEKIKREQIFFPHNIEYEIYMHLFPGMILSAWDIGVLCSTLVMSYLGSRGHKTRWVSCGTFLTSLACFMQLMPHLIFGPGQDALQLTSEYSASFGTNVSNTSLMKGKICDGYYFHRSPSP
jgi:hypothetical protein